METTTPSLETVAAERWSALFMLVRTAAWEYKAAWETGDGEDSSLILYQLLDDLAPYLKPLAPAEPLAAVEQAAAERFDADHRYRQAIRRACATHSLRQVGKAAGVSQSRIHKMLKEQD